MKKKIAFISEHASPLATLGGVDSGGQNVYVAETAKHLSRLGYEIDIYTRWEDDSLPKVVRWRNGIRVVHVSAGPVSVIPKEELLQYMPSFRDDMISFMEEEQLSYGLIHANFYMSAFVAAEIKRILNIPFVVTFHALGQIRRIYQGTDDKFPAERIDIETMAIHEADRVIAECPQDKSDLMKYYSAPSEKIDMVPCGFSPFEFFPIGKKRARSLLGLDPSEKILLQLGRMVPRKGVDTVVQSLSFLKQKSIQSRLVIVGGESDLPDVNVTPEIGRLQKIAKEQGVLDSVTFAGRKNRDMLKYYYSAADIFITTPWYEPFGITPLESMACGTPVIGSKVGGIKYSVEDGKTGLLVPPKNAEALAEAIGKLLTNEARLSEMQKNAITRVNDMFTWSKVSSMLASVYEDVLAPAEHIPGNSVGFKKKSQAA
jgi:glycosyltransferase involved in cell wall biosynthesis